MTGPHATREPPWKWGLPPAEFLKVIFYPRTADQLRLLAERRIDRVKRELEPG